MRALFEQAPGSPQELVDAGLADAIGDHKGALAAAGMASANEVDAATYQRVDPRSLGLRNGPADRAGVRRRRDRARALALRSASQFAADDVGKALDAAAEDDAIRAVVLRINSPGGDAMASDQLWRTVKRVREKKPVVVSMGDYAASGGYYVASAGNAIFSQPATLTGSIGVFMLRPVFAGLYDKLDIGRELIARGGLAAAAGGDGPLDAKQRARLDDLTRAAYHDVPRRASPTAAARPPKRSTSWAAGASGSAARRSRTTWSTSSADSRPRSSAREKEAKLEGDADPVRVILPAPRGPIEQLQRARAGRSERARAALAPAVRAARHAGARLALAARDGSPTCRRTGWRSS